MPIADTLQKVMREIKDEENADHKKTSFWASESETMAFDIFHRFMGTEPTNPIDGEKLVMLKMRKLTELAVVDSLRKTPYVIEELTNNERMYFEWGDYKTPISGYPDLGLMLNNEKVIVEIKTYYGGQQHSQIRIGKVKTSYLKQLAIYMYYYKIKHGVLMMINQGTGEIFEFDLYQDENNEYLFLCPDNDIEINLLDVFNYFQDTYVNYVLKNIEPPLEYFYKYDIEKIDWEKTSSGAIAKARANKAVIGDWQVKFSEYKDLIIERQGTVKGYTDQELSRIKELTNGYSTKKSSKVKFDPNSI